DGHHADGRGERGLRVRHPRHAVGRGDQGGGGSGGGGAPGGGGGGHWGPRGRAGPAPRTGGGSGGRTPPPRGGGGPATRGAAQGGGRGGPRRGQGPMGRHAMKIFSEQHDMFRQSVRAFVEKEVEPHIEEWEQAGQIPRSIWTRMGELGFLGVEYDEKYGGAGA